MKGSKLSTTCLSRYVFPDNIVISKNDTSFANTVIPTPIKPSAKIYLTQNYKTAAAVRIPRACKEGLPYFSLVIKV